MTQAAFPIALSCPLEAVLAERGALPVPEALPILRRLLVQVRALHASGRTHRAIGVHSVQLDPAGNATLTAAEPVWELDGLEADDDSCPPELHGAGAVRLPAEIEAARRELERAGVALDPRRIDVYQLGALLCRLLTGQAVSTYLRSPKTLALVPAALQPVVNQALGYNAAERLADCEAFAAALEVAAASAPTLTLTFPAPGSAATPLFDATPPGEDRAPSAFSGQAHPAAGSKDGLPFERLGHYRILRRIGRGGMGDVYLGYEDALQRPVAIKVLPAELTRSEDFVRRFRTEATAVARVTHPNIVPIYFIGQDAGCHFFVMQYVEGESLDRLLDRRGRLGVDETLAVLEQCLAGLSVAHRAGLVHRDVKPGNVLLEAESGRALVADFGLVKVISAQSGGTATGVVMGTVDYIAPEQARGQEVDGRSDLYSVGVMAYRMISGRLPFEAKTPTAMLFQHAYETPKPLGETAPDAPQALAALVDKLMAKDPAARYQRCEEAAADLRRLRAGTQAAPLTPRPSQIVPAPDWAPPPALPFRLEAAGLWQRLRARLLDWFQARAPELVQRLQNTEQQVDGAVAEYRRRRDRLAGLVGEAAESAGELAAQARSHREAAAAAARRAESAPDAEAARQAMGEKEECERVAVALDAQAAEQQGHIARMQAQLAQVDATLGRLRSQGELLQARLRVAVARQRMEGGAARPNRLRRLAVAAGLGLILLVAGGLFFALWSSRPQVKSAGGEPDATGPKEEITNSIGMKLKLIQPGKFLMGSPKEEEGHHDNESPQHEVEITKAFYMGAYPVTKGQFAAFVQDDGYQTDAEKDGKGGCAWKLWPVTHLWNWEQKPEYTWRHPGFTQGDDHPVVEVSWNDATAFCAWLSKKEGQTYELPTEAEWEYACRAGTKTRFWCGDADDSLKANANVADASLNEELRGVNWTAAWDDGYAFTSPVGSFKANPWGLYDMHGNVLQWCSDGFCRYQEEYIKDPMYKDSATIRVLRGGSWLNEPRVCRSANRYRSDPAYRDGTCGFRVVLRLPARTP